MSLQKQIDEDIKTSLKESNSLKVGVLRMVKSAISNAALAGGNIRAELSDLEVLAVIRKQIAQRMDSLRQFMAANRVDLAKKEDAEIDILKTYLPPELSPQDLDNLISDAIVQTNAVSRKDMKNVLAYVQEKTGGACDSKLISQKLLLLLS